MTTPFATRRILGSVTVALVLAGCASAATTTTGRSTTSTEAQREASATVRFRLRPVMRNLSSPVWVGAPAGDSRLWVVEQTGRVLVRAAGRRRTFLDLRSSVSAGGERGLLGLAFHPRYARNGRFFVNYTDRAGDTRIVEYRASGNAARPRSARLVLKVDQPYSNHNGGHLLFGPDGKLYIGLGDGGAGGDPENRAQNMRSLLGKMLRIDVDAGRPYAVPSDNPFVGRRGIRPEIWASGLRNPWRYSFDRSSGLLFIGDVGQGEWEEIDAVPARSAGRNYGWDAFEGTHVYERKSIRGAHTPPVLEYSHTSGGCSVTGGLVYRGKAAPSLRGRYLYADYCTSWIRSFRPDTSSGVRAADRRQHSGVPQITHFGTNGSGEVFVSSLGGTVYRIGL